MIRKKIAVAGHSGFIGSHLKFHLRQNGYAIIEINRNDFYSEEIFLAEKLKDSFAIINLAGEPIIQRWTKSNKKQIKDSRIHTTRKLCKAISLMKKKPEFYINASAIGIYEYNNEHDENSTNYNNDFSAEIVQLWEETAIRNCIDAQRIIIARFGIVLGKDGGAFSAFKAPTRFGFTTVLGSGSQIISYIHIEDLCDAVFFLLSKTNSGGVYNFTSPYPVSNQVFNGLIAKKLDKFSIKVPAIFLKLRFGKAANMVLKGHAVYPKKLMEEGFKFRYENLDSVLDDLLV